MHDGAEQLGHQVWDIACQRDGLAGDEDAVVALLEKPIAVDAPHEPAIVAGWQFMLVLLSRIADLGYAPACRTAVNSLGIQRNEVNLVVDSEHVGNKEFRFDHPRSNQKIVAGVGQNLYLRDVGPVGLDVLRIVLSHSQRLFERGFRDKDSSDPVLNESARERDDAIALDGLRDYCAREQAEPDVGRGVKPQKMLATPARLHFCVRARNVAIECLDGFRLQIDGETMAGDGRQNNKDDKEPRQFQSAPTGLLAAASTTSR